ncbi:hypothetical protein [Bacillus infantis]|uniref:Uncharacterized protein n=1 Tax=Bacillus infantis TaxID=324767 RepID=A0A5D4RF32_9BACI|nr:hypothetical protein [Bacillus infantis]TYS50073.1 hypothetical protein FZD51_05830 [Bacillus infantis]
MKSLKTVLALTMGFSLLFPLSNINASTTDQSIKAQTAEVLTEEEEFREALKNKESTKVIISEEAGPTYNKDGEIQQFQTLGVDPGTGSTKVVSYAYAGGGLIEKGQKSGIASAIWDSTIVVVAAIVTPVASVVGSVAEIFSDQVAKDQYTTAKTYISYRYIGKEGHVYGNGKWNYWWDTLSRQNYKHYFAAYVSTKGVTRTSTKDYTMDKGYSPVKTDWSANYNSSSTITSRAYYNWSKGYWAYPPETY